MGFAPIAFLTRVSTTVCRHDYGCRDLWSLAYKWIDGAARKMLTPLYRPPFSMPYRQLQSRMMEASSAKEGVRSLGPVASVDGLALRRR
jgi:hypothetical protein